MQRTIKPRNSKKTAETTPLQESPLPLPESPVTYKEKIQMLLDVAKNDPTQRAVGRVLLWLENELKNDEDETKAKELYPVSCTVLPVADSIDDSENSIVEAMKFVTVGTKGGSGVTLECSNIRANGSRVSGNDAMASGPNSFLEPMSAMIGVLRRRGVYKNGAGCAYLDHDHPDLLEWLGYTRSYAEGIKDRLYNDDGFSFNMPPKYFGGNQDIKWIKKALYVDQSVLDNPLLPEIMKQIDAGKLFIARKRYTNDGDRLYSNICMEALLPNRGTCSIHHRNLANIEKVEDLVPAMETAVSFGCNLRRLTRLPDIYLDPQEDRQIMTGDIGLANLLRNFGVTYADFTVALKLAVSDYETGSRQIDEPIYSDDEEIAMKLAYEIVRSYLKGAAIAKQNGMDRAFCIAPTINSAFREPGLVDGLTVAPNIAPPVFDPETRKFSRVSGSSGITTYEYAEGVENAVDVGFDVWFDLADTWQKMMELTGLAHAISFDTWREQEIDKAFMEKFLGSNLVSLYYRIDPNQSTSKKNTISVDGISMEGVDLSITDDGKSIKTDFFAKAEDVFGKRSTVEELKTKPTLPDSPCNDEGFCQTCSG